VLAKSYPEGALRDPGLWHKTPLGCADRLSLGESTGMGMDAGTRYEIPLGFDRELHAFSQFNSA